MSFFEDLKRRNVIRVAAAYAIVAWLVIQIAETIFPLFGFDDGPARIVVILLVIGFPLTLIFSWVYEFTPDGLKLERDIDPTRSNTHHSGKKLDRMIIVGLTLAVGYFATDKFIFDPARDATLEEIVEERVRDEMLIESNGDRSVAVMPFADMSPNGDQEYFGDGIAEELINELARLKGLRVAGRTSSFSFKGKNESLSAIAEALNVATILEGSIRKDADQIRITAKLINVADDRVLYSKPFERELTEIFAIQEEIATEVSMALGVTLGVGGVNAFRGAGTRNIEAYELFHQTLGVWGDDAIRLLEGATRLDPNYAAAWSRLANRVGVTAIGTLNPDERREIAERSHQYNLTAIELDPESAFVNSGFGLHLAVRKEWIRAEAFMLKAMSLVSDYNTLGKYGSLMMRTGRSSAALAPWEKAVAVEPFWGEKDHGVYVALAQERFTDARELLAGADSLEDNAELSIALNEGDSKEIKAILAAMPPKAISTTALYAPVLSVFDSREMVLSRLREAYADNSSWWPSKRHDIAILAAYFGDPELALHAIGEDVRESFLRMYALWYPLMSDVRQLQGFKELMTDLNLVAYWRASGWADLCRPLGDEDFTCW
ncbi:MAG: tetratricopeptide repeat protein [Pseudomonadales bacterium]